jgi:hypothetical protein
MDSINQELAVQSVVKRVVGRCKYKRDPHLPSPEVCDFLLDCEWSDSIPKVSIEFSEADKSVPTSQHLFGHSMTHVAVGADHIAEIFIQDDALALLEADAKVRQFMTDILGED